ncbi:MAG: hypothetical protein IJ630_05225 [Treponema sp.]|nr:hypothetical protein [Treponema sp.]
MQEQNVENLPELVKNGEISVSEAVNLMWEDIYLEPYRYGLFYFSEDQKSEFLLVMRKKFKKILLDYKRGQLSFIQYLAGKITNYKMSFLREQLESENERKSMESFLKSKTEEEYQKYENGIEASKKESESDNCLKNFTDIIQTGGSQKLRKKKIAELTALVLMMKACKDVDDSTVCAVSDFTQIDRNLLYQKIQELKATIEKKDEISLRLVAKRNNAFFFHRKYFQEMVAPTSTERKKKIMEKKYDGQTKKWEKHNKTIIERSDSPSIEEVAKAIGIKPRMVSFYINNAKRKNGRSQIQELLLEKRRKELLMKGEGKNVFEKVAEKALDIFVDERKTN